jgi:sugar/nucleoside kinase (ribokinase family)
MVRDADLIALVNWSELGFADRLWKSFYQYCAANIETDKTKFMLFDLCDMGRKTSDEIKNILTLIGGFSPMRQTILSLNYNEALEAGAALEKDGTGKLHGGEARNCPGTQDAESLAAIILGACPVNEVVIHSRSGALSLSETGCFHSPAQAVEKPAISTGSGDTFNAAYGLASVLGLGPRKSLDLAQAAARRYVSGLSFLPLCVML